MTLLDAEQYDFARARRRRTRIGIALVVLVIVAWVAYHLRNFPERHAVNQFFSALEGKSYEQAYAIWRNDPQWKQHPEKYSSYSYKDFYADWGPGGQWGLVHSHSIECSLSTQGGVIVQATVNERHAERSNLWIDTSDKTFSFPPNEIQCGNWWAWLTE
jgi:hypothetical protein